MAEETPLTEPLLQQKQVPGQEQMKVDDSNILEAAEEGEGIGAEINDSSAPWERGVKQPSKFRDLPYAIVFMLHFLFILSYFPSLVKYMKENWNSGNGDEYEPAGNKIVFGIAVSIMPAFLFSIIYIYLAFIVLKKLGAAFITYSLWFGVAVSAATALFALAQGLTFLGIMCALNALISTCYAIAVRSRIPFAAANLDAGVTAVKKNLGIFLFPFISAFVTFIYVGLWTYSLCLVTGVTIKVNEENPDESHIEMSRPGWVLPWVLCLFWTMQVSHFTVHTITAGLVGTWYFDPTEASGYCSKALMGSMKRALSYSFGSICLGSVLVAIIQFLDWLVQSLRQQRAENGDRDCTQTFILCCLDCILQMLEGIMEYFNKWAFIYVGVYGYPYLTAGKKVMALFEQRGWSVIINDNLVSQALGLLSILIALLIGISSYVLVPLLFNTINEPSSAIFWANFVAGWIIVTMSMSILNSSVCTVVLCFAEAPGELEVNHGALSRKMREGWNKVYPTIRC